MTKEELRKLWEDKETIDNVVKVLFARNIGGLSADDRFDHELAIQAAIGSQIRARDAFFAAAQKWSCMLPVEGA